MSEPRKILKRWKDEENIEYRAVSQGAEFFTRIYFIEQREGEDAMGVKRWKLLGCMRSEKYGDKWYEDDERFQKAIMSLGKNILDTIYTTGREEK